MAISTATYRRRATPGVWRLLVLLVATELTEPLAVMSAATVGSCRA